MKRREGDIRGKIKELDTQLTLETEGKVPRDWEVRSGGPRVGGNDDDQHVFFHTDFRFP